MRRRVVAQLLEHLVGVLAERGRRPHRELLAGDQDRVPQRAHLAEDRVLFDDDLAVCLQVRIVGYFVEPQRRAERDVVPDPATFIHSSCVFVWNTCWISRRSASSPPAKS